jgi:hypothetical protein
LFEPKHQHSKNYFKHTIIIQINFKSTNTSFSFIHTFVDWTRMRVNKNKLYVLNQHAAWLFVTYCVSIQQKCVLNQHEKFSYFNTHWDTPTESTRKFLLCITNNLWIKISLITEYNSNSVHCICSVCFLNLQLWNLIIIYFNIFKRNACIISLTYFLGPFELKLKQKSL